ncbi:TonB-dependent receptor [Hydrogenimonas sp.]|nr:TonB-dependent receptor [Hydrogenimonas sp.]
MKRFINILVILSAFYLTAYGNNVNVKNLLESIGEDAHEIGVIAEKTGISEPYQPYIISVFTGKELERLGVSNLKEALLLVPGVDIATDNMDNQRLVFRGSNPFAYGQSKLFIDGVEVNDLFFDSYGPWLSMPIEMIKRIEVTRGPGGISNGVNAYAGSIRVITYAEHLPSEKSPKKVVAKIGSYDYKMAGAVLRHSEGDFSVYADIYYQKDDKSLYVGKDSLSTGRYGAVNVPLSKDGDAPLWMRSYMLGLRMQYGALRLDLRSLYYERGSAFGINGMLPEPSDHAKFPISFAQISYDKSFENFALVVDGGVKLSSFKSASMLAPDGLVFPVTLTSTGFIDQPLVFSEGFYGIHEVEQRQLYQSSNITYSGVESHRLDVGYFVSSEKVLKEVTITTDRSDGIGLVDYSQTLPFTDPNAKRNTFRFFIQDRYRYSEKLTFQAGLNVEKSSDISTQFNPRVSAVYQLNGSNVYKLIYSRSTRTPSWQEVYTLNNNTRVGNHDLEPEVVNAWEAAYIHRFGTGEFVQLNLFYLKNSDQIDNLNEDYQYRNSGSSDIWGATVEYKAHIGNRGKIYFNYTWLNGKKSDDSPLDNAAHNLAKATYYMSLSENWNIGAVARYVGSKIRASYDYRTEKVPAYSTLDLTLGFTERGGFKTRLSVKNVFDAEIRYPSEPYTYDTDYPAEGRTVMLTLAKAF